MGYGTVPCGSTFSVWRGKVQQGFQRVFELQRSDPKRTKEKISRPMSMSVDLISTQVKKLWNNFYIISFADILGISGRLYFFTISETTTAQFTFKPLDDLEVMELINILITLITLLEQ